MSDYVSCALVQRLTWLNAVSCRKRMIRCQLAPDSSQGPCSSCIRSKRECCFDNDVQSQSRCEEIQALDVRAAPVPVSLSCLPLHAVNSIDNVQFPSQRPSMAALDVLHGRVDPSDVDLGGMLGLRGSKSCSTMSCLRYAKMYSAIA